MKTISLILVTGAAALCSIGQSGIEQSESRQLAGLFFMTIGVTLLMKVGVWLKRE